MTPSTTFGEAFKKYWKNYFNFKGRARRSEFWWMVLGNFFMLLPFFSNLFNLYRSNNLFNNGTHYYSKLPTSFIGCIYLPPDKVCMFRICRLNVYT